MFRLTVRSLAGEEIAGFEAKQESSVAEATRLLADLAPPRKGCRYTLVGPNGVMPESSSLKEVLGTEEVEHGLTAYVEPWTVLRLAGKPTGAAQLPGCGDLIIATMGFLTEEERAEDVPALGQDDGPRSRLWLWRLPLASGYKPQATTLLARKRCWSDQNIQNSFTHHLDLFKKKSYFGQDRHLDGWTCLGGSEMWTFEELATAAAVKHSGKAKCPPPKPYSIQAFLHAHSDRYVLITWSGGPEGDFIDRLDVETGGIKQLHRGYDLWSVATDPVDGRIFCSCCYDGWTIQLVRSCTVDDDNKVRERHDDEEPESNLLITYGCGPGFSFDPELRVLVVPDRRNSDFVNVLCDPESPERERLLSLPGAEAVDRRKSVRESCTPGDRDHPWACVRVPVVAPGGAGGWEQDPDWKNDWASLFVSCRDGQVLKLQDDMLRVRSMLFLGSPSPTAGDDRAFSTGRKIAAFAGHFGGDHPLVLIEGSQAS